MSPSSATKKNHNSPMQRVLVGGGVVVGHPSTNHNSPHGRVVPFLWHKTFPIYIYIYILMVVLTDEG